MSFVIVMTGGRSLVICLLEEPCTLTFDFCSWMERYSRFSTLSASMKREQALRNLMNCINQRRELGPARAIQGSPFRWTMKRPEILFLENQCPPAWSLQE